MMKKQTDFDKTRMRISFQVNLLCENLRQAKIVSGLQWTWLFLHRFWVTRETIGHAQVGMKNLSVFVLLLPHSWEQFLDKQCKEGR